MHRNILLLARGFAIAALALSLGGCGGTRRHDVTGQVKYNGAPLAKPNGKIVFVGPDGSQVEGTIGQDGTYKAARVTAGLNRIAIYYPNPAHKRASRPKGKATMADRPVDSPVYLTPETYANTETSELSTEVGPGTVFNYDMKGPPIP